MTPTYYPGSAPAVPPPYTSAYGYPAPAGAPVMHQQPYATNQLPPQPYDPTHYGIAPTVVPAQPVHVQAYPGPPPQQFPPQYQQPVSQAYYQPQPVPQATYPPQSYSQPVQSNIPCNPPPSAQPTGSDHDTKVSTTQFSH